MVNTLYGANHVLAKGVMPQFLTPNVFILFRILGATILFWLVKSFYVKEKIDKRTGVRIEVNPKQLRHGECALVKITPSTPVCIEAYSDFPGLGRFILSDMKEIVSIGIITSVVKKINKNSICK